MSCGKGGGKTKGLPKEITGPDLYLKLCVWLFPALTSFISLATLAVLSAQKQDWVYRVAELKGGRCWHLCESVMWLLFFFLFTQYKNEALKVCLNVQLRFWKQICMSCDKFCKSLYTIWLQSIFFSVLTFLLFFLSLYPLFSPSLFFFFHCLRNQAMRKKLILYFKRRNHARKQWVSRKLHLWISVGLMTDASCETGPAIPWREGAFKAYQRGEGLWAWSLVSTCTIPR